MVKRSKRGKAGSGPDKCRAAARVRAARDTDLNFPVGLSSPAVPVEKLEKILPLSPKVCLRGGHRLTHSPAYTWLDLSAKGEVSKGAQEMIERWPFRIARPEERAGPWVCLALMAYEQRCDISRTARSLVELEEARLMHWSNEHNVYLMGGEVAGLRDDPNPMATLDALSSKLATETPRQRAARRWLRPKISAVPSD